MLVLGTWSSVQTDEIKYKILKTAYFSKLYFGHSLNYSRRFIRGETRARIQITSAKKNFKGTLL